MHRAQKCYASDEKKIKRHMIKLKIKIQKARWRPGLSLMVLERILCCNLLLCIFSTETYEVNYSTPKYPMPLIIWDKCYA